MKRVWTWARWVLLSLAVLVVVAVQQRSEEIQTLPAAASPGGFRSDLPAEDLRELAARISELERHTQQEEAVPVSQNTGEITRMLARFAERLDSLEDPPNARPPVARETESRAAKRIHLGSGAWADEPAHAIPPGTVFLDVTLSTALLGRLPLDGEVVAPFPFIAVARQPYIAPHRPLAFPITVVVMGTVVGDGTLSCVRAQIERVVLHDEGGSFTVAEPLSNSLGYLTDPSGHPCISGDLQSLSTRRIAVQGVLSAIEESAASRSALSSSLALGNLNQSGFVTGQLSRASRDSFFQGALAGVREEVARRARGLVDVVVVPASTPLLLHVREAIPVSFAQAVRAGSPLAPVRGVGLE